MEKFEFVPEFAEDMEIIQKLGDNPNSENGLTGDGLKIEFDKSGVKIKGYINDSLVPVLNTWAQQLKDYLDKSDNVMQGGVVVGEMTFEAPTIMNGSVNMNGAVTMKTGATFGGPVNLGGNKITGVPTPSEGADAANKEFVETFVGGAVETVNSQMQEGFNTLDMDKLSMELLWENASPSSDFGATTSPISLGDSVKKYSHFMIEFSSDGSCIVRKGSTFYLPRITITSSDDEKTGYVNWYQRAVSISDNGASIGNCFRMAGSTGNGITTKRETTLSYLKPYRIWGIGGVG